MALTLAIIDFGNVYILGMGLLLGMGVSILSYFVEVQSFCIFVDNWAHAIVLLRLLDIMFYSNKATELSLGK